MKEVLYRINAQSTGHEKRLFELLAKYNSVVTNYHGTWCELFKTKGYKRFEVYRDKASDRIATQILRIEPNATFYTADLLGSRKMIDVHMRRGQDFLITLKVKE